MPKYINRDFISYGLSKKNDYFANDISIGMDGVSYNLNNKEKRFIVEAQISGIFSVYNSMAAIVAASIIGVENTSITSAIRDLKAIDGRLEKISDGIYIDYAHTPNAFEEIIKCVREFSKNKKLIVLFGCGGDRDKTKRGPMGKIASEMADVVIITSDNSRSEDKEAIIGDIITGINKNKPFYVVPDRREAIELGVGIRGDNMLLILGKGHEKYEIDKNVKHYFCEADIIKQALKKYETIS
jgi:UDP-N-acetylmuramoyl-L-alanyl-D-glutamate--2,6-diaminopimelate ligase